MQQQRRGDRGAVRGAYRGAVREYRGAVRECERAANEKIKVTLLTKATGGFWDAMIAGAKQYETDHPNDIELTTNACKTNDDTPCQIARDPGRCHQGRPGDRDLPDGRWRHRCPQ